MTTEGRQHSSLCSCSNRASRLCSGVRVCTLCPAARAEAELHRSPDTIVITALNVTPFCYHADLMTMSRPELFTVAGSSRTRCSAPPSVLTPPAPAYLCQVREQRGGGTPPKRRRSDTPTHRSSALASSCPSSPVYSSMERNIRAYSVVSLPLHFKSSKS